MVDGQHVGANRPIVCKLRRSLYGLRQAGRVWVILFASFLISWGLVRSSIDCCLYTYTSPSDEILWIAVYVDDALICDNSPELRARFVADLSERFPTEDKGELSWILNVAITHLGLVIICEHEPFVHWAVEVPSQGGVEKVRGELGGEVGDEARIHRDRQSAGRHQAAVACVTSSLVR